MELQFYIKNISRCLGMVYLISASRQYNHWNTQKSVLIFLQVDYIQTKIKCNKTSVFTRNLQAHKLYSPSYILLQTQNIAPVRTLPHLLKPIMIHILHLKQFYQWFNNLIRNWTNNMKNCFSQNVYDLNLRRHQETPRNKYQHLFKTPWTKEETLFAYHIRWWTTLRIWVSETDLESKLTGPNWKLKQTLPTILHTYKMTTPKTWLLLIWNYPLSHQINFLILLISHTMTYWNDCF